AHWSVLAWRDRMTWADAKRTWRRRSHTCVERRRDVAAAAAEQRPCAPAADLGPTRRPVPPISHAGGWDRGNGAAWRGAGRAGGGGGGAGRAGGGGGGAGRAQGRPGAAAVPPRRLRRRGC